MNRMRVILTVALVLVCAAAASGGTDSKLRGIVDELKTRRAELKQVMRDERDATRVLSDLDETLVRTRRELALLDKKVARLEKDVVQLKSQVAVDTEALAALKDRLRARLRSLARMGGDGYLRFLLSAHSVDELAVRRALLRRVAARDAALLRDVQQGKARLNASRSSLEQRYLELSASREANAQALSMLEEVRVERGEALLGIGRQRGTLEAQIDALRISEKKLKREIWSKSSSSRKLVGLALKRGQLPWPTLGKVEAKQGAGAAHATGWILRAPMGAKVRAVAAGKVVHAGFLRGYGLLVIIDHGDGYHSLCAHLARNSVDIGDQISQGEEIGFVGDSESFDGAKLYFELRQGGRPVDPARWLGPKP